MYAPKLSSEQKGRGESKVVKDAKLLVYVCIIIKKGGDIIFGNSATSSSICLGTNQGILFGKREKILGGNNFVFKQDRFLKFLQIFSKIISFAMPFISRSVFLSPLLLLLLHNLHSKLESKKYSVFEILQQKLCRLYIR